MAAHSLCRIELFGGLRVQQGERVITRFPTRKVASLLAYLASYPQQAHPREALIDLFWQESVLQAGRASLSQALSTLRRQIEPPGIPAGSVLVTTGTEVRLNPEALTTDLADFERFLQRARTTQSSMERAQSLQQAVALYRGEFLPGFYEEWALTEQRRLAALCLQAARDLSSHFKSAGDLPPAIEYARQAVSLDPLEEEAHRELMGLYAAAGQTAAALSRTCR